MNRLFNSLIAMVVCTTTPCALGQVGIRQAATRSAPPEPPEPHEQIKTNPPTTTQPSNPIWKDELLDAGEREKYSLDLAAHNRKLKSQLDSIAAGRGEHATRAEEIKDRKSRTKRQQEAKISLWFLEASLHFGYHQDAHAVRACKSGLVALQQLWSQHPFGEPHLGDAFLEVVHHLAQKDPSRAILLMEDVDLLWRSALYSLKRGPVEKSEGLTPREAADVAKNIENAIQLSAKSYVKTTADQWISLDKRKTLTKEDCKTACYWIREGGKDDPAYLKDHIDLLHTLEARGSAP